MKLRPLEGLFRGLLGLLRRCDRRPRSPQELGSRAIRRILVVSSTAIGDTLLSTPALHSLRVGYPWARITLLVDQRYQDLVRENGDADEILGYCRGWRHFLMLLVALRRRAFDLAVILHGNEPQATPLAYLAGARWIFKLPARYPTAFLLSHGDEAVPGFDGLHVVRKRLAVARLAGGAPVSEEMHLPRVAGADAAVEHWLQARGCGRNSDSPLIALQLGASEQHRQWPVDRFAALVRQRLARAPAEWFVVTGAPAEAELCASLVRDIGSPRCFSSAGELPLAQLPALFARCQALVTGDTGPMHVAVAVKTPVVGLFASADHRRTGPLQDPGHHRVIQKPLTCEPCLGRRCPYTPALCMQTIGVEEVDAALDAILYRAAGRSAVAAGGPTALADPTPGKTGS